jgi:hypothetical protein
MSRIVIPVSHQVLWSSGDVRRIPARSASKGRSWRPARVLGMAQQKTPGKPGAMWRGRVHRTAQLRIDTSKPRSRKRQAARSASSRQS